MDKLKFTPLNNEVKRNEEIEVLRAVAVFFVLLHHYEALIIGYPTLYPYVEGLFSGVDLFFCISGYVIARNLIPKLLEKTGVDFLREVGVFWIKRWYRIIPSALLWVVATLVILGPSVLKGNAFLWYDTFAAIFQYANIHFYHCTVDPTTRCLVFQQYWSLSLEEQFYLLIPLVIFIFRKHLVYFMIILALLQVITERHHWSGISGFMRTDAIAFGVLLAIISFQPFHRFLEPTALKGQLGRIVPVFLLTGIAVIPTIKPIPQYMGLLSLFCLMIVWLASYEKGYVIGPGKMRRWMVKVGERSFAIYLGQIVVFNLAQKISNMLLSPYTSQTIPKVLITIFIGALTMFVFVELSYRFVELPWRNRGRLLADRFNIPASSAKRFSNS